MQQEVLFAYHEKGIDRLSLGWLIVKLADDNTAKQDVQGNQRRVNTDYVMI